MLISIEQIHLNVLPCPNVSRSLRATVYTDRWFRKGESINQTAASATLVS